MKFSFTRLSPLVTDKDRIWECWISEFFGPCTDEKFWCPENLHFVLVGRVKSFEVVSLPSWFKADSFYLLVFLLPVLWSLMTLRETYSFFLLGYLKGHKRMGIICRQQSPWNDADMAGCFPDLQSRGKNKSLILFIGLCSLHRSSWVVIILIAWNKTNFFLNWNHYPLGKQAYRHLFCCSVLNTWMLRFIFI